jgi:UDP-N-acetylmuramate: L-alanyl-gamma-D-glutamyl-meso-diaminopimelate ligase
MTNFFDIPDMHLVGIKGVAMASLASCLDDRGVRVTGSDVAEDFVTKEILAQRGFKISIGFDATHIPKNCGLVIYTGAHQGKNNPEVKEAIHRGIPVMSHAEALGTLMHGKKGISVCGTGGKSTTSSMVSWILDSAGFRPSFAIGVGKVNNFGVSGRYTQIYSQHTDEISLSGWFVAEADEYAVDPTSDHRPRFSYQDPKVIIATNLTYDHPDIYSNFDKMKETFYTFFEGDGKFVVANGDSEALSSSRVRNLSSRIFVGTKQHNDFVLKNMRVHDKRSEADLEYNFTGSTMAWNGDKSIHIILQFKNLLQFWVIRFFTAEPLLSNINFLRQ